jgi:eukaryotic-like serine/threonine-protein kinase
MLPLCEKIYGPDHGFTLNITSNLAGALRQQGTPEKIAASGPYYKRTLDGEIKRYGEKNPNTIRARHNYANYLLDVGDVAQAIALQTQCVADAKEVFGADHAVTGEAEFGLGKAQLKAGNFAVAESALLTAFDVRSKDFAPNHWRLDEYMTPLQDLYTAWKKPEKAAEWKTKRAALDPKPPNAI